MKLRGKVAISRGIDPEIMKYEIMKYELGTSGFAQGTQRMPREKRPLFDFLCDLRLKAPTFGATLREIMPF